MPRGDVAGTGSGSERRACDHSVCMFELWSPEISGPGTSAYYRKTLAGAMTEPKPLTYDEHKATEAAFRGYLPNADWTDSAQEIMPVYLRRSPNEEPLLSTPQTRGTLKKSVGNS